MGFYSKEIEKEEKNRPEGFYSKSLAPKEEVILPEVENPQPLGIDPQILTPARKQIALPQSTPKIDQGKAKIVNGEFVYPPENPGTEVPQLEIPNDPNVKMREITEGAGTDSEKILKIKKLYPNAVVTRSKEGAILHVQGKKIPILKPGTENLPEINTPNIRVLDGQKVGGAIVSDDTARRSKTTYARTMEGKQNIMNSYVKEAFGDRVDPARYVRMTTDSYGNTVINIKKDFGTKNWKFKKGRYYENNFDRVDAGINHYGPMIAASIASGGVGWLRAMLQVGAGAGTGEYVQGSLNESAGIESFSWGRVAEEAGIGAIGEGAGRAVIAGVAKFFSKFKTDIIKFDNTGNITPEYRAELVKNGMPEESITPEFTAALKKEMIDEASPKQAARMAESSELDIKLTPAQATREFKAMQEESALVKNNDSGGELRRQLAVQDEKLFKHLDTAEAKTGGDADKFVMGERAKTALAEDEALKIKAGGEKYTKGKKAPGNADEIPREDFTKRMRTVMDDWSEDIPGGVAKRLVALMNDTQPITLKSTENLIKLINQHRKTAMKGDAKWSSLAAVRKEVYALQRNMGKNSAEARKLFDEGRSLVEARKGEYNLKDIVRKINTEGEVADENVLRSLLASNVSKKDFDKALGLFARTSVGRKAIKDMQALIIRQLREKAVIGQGADEVSFSAKKFTKELNLLLNSRKLEKLFKPKEVEFLKKISRVANMRNFPDIAYNPSGTFGALVNWLDKNKMTGPLMTLLSPITKPIKEHAAEVAAKKAADKLLSKHGMKAATKRAANAKPKRKAKLIETKMIVGPTLNILNRDNK